MKEGLIKILDEANLFYDSEDRLYRYRMHCPYCGKESGCRCLNTLEKAEDYIVDGVELMCSSKCVLDSFFDEWDKDDIGNTMKEMGIIWRLKWYVYKYIGYISEKDAYEVIDTIEFDFDSVDGESC